MNILRSAIATAMLLSLAACAPMPRTPPATVRAADCNTAASGARCDVNVRVGTQYSCDLGRFDIDPDLLNLRGGRPVNITWTLPDAYGFCGDDNVYLKPSVTSDFRQSYESFGADNLDGSRGPNSMVGAACKSKWHWNWRNSGTDLYPYNLQFTDRATGRKCTIDPWVRNG
jgi:hypothetical protein